jgi:hypothetical protein
MKLLLSQTNWCLPSSQVEVITKEIPIILLEETMDSSRTLSTRFAVRHPALPVSRAESPWLSESSVL